MKVPKHHRWDLTPKEAMALQRELASGLPAAGPRFTIERIVGVDVSYDKRSDRLWGGVVVLDYRSLGASRRAGACSPPQHQISGAHDRSRPWLEGVNGWEGKVRREDLVHDEHEA